LVEKGVSRWAAILAIPVSPISKELLDLDNLSAKMPLQSYLGVGD
jgi:hypothetical protein